PDGLEEVGEVLGIAAAVPLLDHLALEREGRAAAVVRTDEIALAAVPDVADVVAALLAALRWVRADRRQTADLEDQLAVAIVEDANLRVRRLAVVDVTEATADAEDALRQFGLAEAPAGLVHLVNALVAEVAVAVVPDPVPVVVQLGPHHRLERRRTGP